MSKIEFGEMPCRECGAPVKVLRADNGTFSYRCLARGCDDADYAKFGSLKNQSWLKKIKPYDDQPSNKQAENQPKKQPEVKPKQNNEPNIWGL